jgi:hypothetical protein
LTAEAQFWCNRATPLLQQLAENRNSSGRLVGAETAAGDRLTLWLGVDQSLWRPEINSLIGMAPSVPWVRPMPESPVMT